MSGPYLYRDEKLLRQGFIVARLIYGLRLQRSRQIPGRREWHHGNHDWPVESIWKCHGCCDRIVVVGIWVWNFGEGDVSSDAILFAGSPYPLPSIMYID